MRRSSIGLLVDSSGRRVAGTGELPGFTFYWHFYSHLCPSTAQQRTQGVIEDNYNLPSSITLIEYRDDKITDLRSNLSSLKTHRNRAL